MNMTSERNRSLELNNTTDGLVSGYQITQVTGGQAGAIDTGWTFSVAVAPYRRVLPHVMPAGLPEPKTDQTPHEEFSPELARFNGPYGVQHTKEELARLFRQRYRPANEEIGYLDVPEDIL